VNVRRDPLRGCRADESRIDNEVVAAGGLQFIDAMKIVVESN
jgi:hypothetical protein